MFVDSARIKLTAGKGGNGVVAWRREKYVPKGGPVGGNGGNGGSILLKADRETPSLESFRNRRLIQAENGLPGGGNLCKGRNGETLTLKVPCGTLLKDLKTGSTLFDFVKQGQEFLVCAGGKGGKGNHCFKSPTNQAPNLCTLGTAGESIEVELELKLIADIGLIGMPNAGKSTLMKQFTHVPVKIGAYPFTTLRPNLGYLYVKGGDRILLADIPGIIENAHQNKGLGFAFLRHIERSSALLFVIDVAGWEGRVPLDDFLVLQNELRSYRPELLDKPFLIALNKMDQEGAQENLQQFYDHYPKETLFPISAVNKDGLEPLIAALHQLSLPPQILSQSEII